MKEDERLDSSSKSSSSTSLPVSYGVDYEQYDISSSPSLSQPFSPEGSSNRSRVLENNLSSAFSLDHNNSFLILSRDRPCSCLQHVFLQIPVDSAEMLWLPLLDFLLPLLQFIFGLM
ncbi:unnamed protein product [Microthlaspi erraticum]|uniref:Uncharacterized protein n=1 Tax=Microthlaspi erraticum TaxID=1685480 RepID=A0A6D2HPL6_9BRAS|nr:unnamed protein product [Microthlaspi erraticum]